ncbi:MAG: ATP-dependent DNA helicase UvrD2 [Micrococcales bacterium]|nr:ATP-dependent DNA helicase UvrD2 [Micrococcales bacterium]
MVSVSRHDDAERILEGLDPEQRQVAAALVGPVCVVAGAGTGKTRAVTHRIAYGVRTGTYNPAAVMALTFTTKAAGELRERLAALGVSGVQARTFHSAALRQLSYFLPRVEHRAVPRLVEHKARLVATAARRLGLEVDRAAIRDLAAEIEWAKVNLWTAQDYQTKAAKAGRGQPGGYAPLAVARLMNLYEEILSESQAMDFEDVLLATAGLLMSHPAVANQVRSQYRHYVVDEYQDVSPLQQRLLDLWLGERQEVCVVGDPAQTIYTFAGARSDFLTGFTRRYPKAVRLELVRDYRSTPQVVGLANAVVRAGPGVGAVELVAQRPAGPEVRFQRYGDDTEEATGVVQQIADLIEQGVPAEEIAVLYRANSQSEPFEAALASAGIAHKVRGGERFFDRPEVRQALVLLRAESKTSSDLTELERVHEVLRGSGWTPQPPSTRGAQRETWESLDALASLSQDLLSGGAGTLAELVAQIDFRASNQHAPTPAGVQLASLHASKGLEWEAVFLVGLSNGLMPISLADTPAQVEEERRLLYVGITRAKVHLFLSFAAARVVGGSANRRASRFLKGLWPGARRSTSSGGKPAVPALADLTAQQAAVFEALKQWRLDLAKQAGLPAFTVLTNVTLRALAVEGPTTVKDLAAIPGIGPSKLERYGEELLGLLAAFQPDESS